MPAAWTADPSWQVAAAPEGRIAAAAAASAATRIAIAERDRRPDPTVSLYGGRKDLGTGAGSEGVVGLAVSVPLFVRNNLSAELAAARADASAATAEQRRAELELRARAERTCQHLCRRARRVDSLVAESGHGRHDARRSPRAVVARR